MAKVQNLSASKIRPNSFILTFDQLNDYRNYKVYINDNFYREITKLNSIRFFDGLNYKISCSITGTNDNIDFEVKVSTIHDGIEDEKSDPITVKTGYFFTNPDGSDVLTSKLDYAYNPEFGGINQETIDRLDTKLRANPLPVDIQTVTIPQMNIGDVKIEDKDVDGRKLNVVLENQNFLTITSSLPISVKNLTISKYDMLYTRRLDDPLVINSDYGLITASYDKRTHELLQDIIDELKGIAKNPINIFNGPVTVTNNVETVILTATVPIGKTWKIQGFVVWGDIWAEYFLKIDGAVIGGCVTTPAKMTTNINYQDGTKNATANKIVTITVLYKIGTNRKFNANLYGIEI